MEIIGAIKITAKKNHIQHIRFPVSIKSLITSGSRGVCADSHSLRDFPKSTLTPKAPIDAIKRDKAIP